ncbi:two-component system, OmpR family, response regulator [Sphingomonas gellani]|uniref:Two-component system, OmpR family, response regulator n=1 Tax=Sphingomonas gellani TaxID=1166340 RepID=A0A1H8D091_9SPHN|nr:response regulator transcription factor [Sphingomonas gellani]SEN00008.1 two-component system, OmpR family, response regulator [Sphingomonas gellani]
MDLLLVEDDEPTAQTLAEELRALDHRVVVAEDGAAALVAVERDSFDAVILDRMLPRMDGATVVRRLRERGRSLPVLMLSALGRWDQKVDGLDAGADDYVTKPTPAAEIDARLKALIRARGWTSTEAETIRAGDIVISPTQHRAWRDGVALDLARLEFRLLLELARQAGGYLTRAMLIERVWGYDFEPTANIVDAQVLSLRRKLTGNGGDDPIVTKRGVGYMLQA